MRVRGIDVSSVQGKIDWAQVAASGVQFVMRKCGNGNNAADPGFAADVASARAAGLTVGAYHVGFPLPTDPAHPGRDPVDQAKMHFDACEGVGSRNGELPPALDLEWPVPGTPEWTKYGCSAPQVRAWALAYLAAAEKLWGRLPLLYDGFPDYWRDIGGWTDVAFTRYPLWVVHYPGAYRTSIPIDGGTPDLPQPWTEWVVWQHCGGGLRLPGGAPVDGNVFNGDIEAFRAWLRLPQDAPVENVT